MSDYTLHELHRLIGGELLGEGMMPISHLAFDSRLDHPFQETLFIAIQGERNDGHKHISELYVKGVRNFLVEKCPERQDADATFLVVPNCLEAIQRIAGAHRQKFELPVVGITGSNGKTIVKEWLNQLLKEDYFIVRSPGSWNSQIGVPLSIWQLENNHELGIFEAGVSKSGEMRALQNIIKPSVGIFTNLGAAHAAGFEDVEEKAKEKALLFSECDKVVFCADHESVEKVLSCNARKAERLISWARDKQATLRVLSEEPHGAGTDVLFRYDGKAHEIHIPFQDKASIENAIHCLLTALILGAELTVLKSRFLDLRPLAMRLEALEGINGSTILNDCYSNDPVSLTVALDHLKRISGKRKKVVILSDMIGIDKRDDALYKEVEQQLKDAGVQAVHVIGKKISAQFKNAASSSENAGSFLRSLDEGQFNSAAILIKGARSFGLEKIAKRLQAKSHGCVLKVDLGAIKHNLDIYRSLLVDRTKMMVMLKAFGYGSGAPALARLLEYEQVDYFGVAYANEGIQLRQEGIGVPIMVMNSSGIDWDTFERFNLEPTIHGFDQLRSYKRYAGQAENPPGIHIEFDTGMHRLGFSEDQLDELLEELGPVVVKSVFSHLAASDSEAHDSFTQEQIRSFEICANAVQQKQGKPLLMHILNSSGITRFPKAQFDMVRLGIGLYGYDPSATKLRSALRLSAEISQVKRIKKGESIGYDRSFVAEQDMSMAVLPLGYADGLRRSLSNGVGSVSIKGVKAPIVGKVCMDMCMIDVSRVDCAAGDEVVFFDSKDSLFELAEKLGTIPYELLTSFSERIERRYVREA